MSRCSWTLPGTLCVGLTAGPPLLSRLGTRLDWVCPQLSNCLSLFWGVPGPQEAGWAGCRADGGDAQAVLPPPALPAVSGFAGSAFTAGALPLAQAVTRGLWSEEQSGGLGAAGAGQGKAGAAAAAGTEAGGRDVQLQCTLCTLRSLPRGWAPDPPCRKQTLTEERLFLQGLSSLRIKSFSSGVFRKVTSVQG